MCNKAVAVVSTVVAVALAVLTVVIGIWQQPAFWHQSALTYINVLNRFFYLMFPPLIAGALIKYLFSCTCKKQD